MLYSICHVQCYSESRFRGLELTLHRGLDLCIYNDPGCIATQPFYIAEFSFNPCRCYYILLCETNPDLVYLPVIVVLVENHWAPHSTLIGIAMCAGVVKGIMGPYTCRGVRNPR